MRVLPLLGGTCIVISSMPLWSVDIALRSSYRLKYKKTVVNVCMHKFTCTNVTPKRRNGAQSLTHALYYA